MNYAFTLRGLTAMLMHKDDVLASDELIKWRKDPGNKSFSTPGDDRSPIWTWLAYVYHNGVNVTIPTKNLRACFGKAATQVILKAPKTYKELFQAGVIFPEEHCDFSCCRNGGKPQAIPLQPFAEAKEQTYIGSGLQFEDHEALAKEHGFGLDVARVSIGASKHVRVRPKFNTWEVRGIVEVILEREIPMKILQQIMEIGGARVGLGDWRPGSPKKPGPYGRFEVELKKA